MCGKLCVANSFKQSISTGYRYMGYLNRVIINLTPYDVFKLRFSNLTPVLVRLSLFSCSTIQCADLNNETLHCSDSFNNALCLVIYGHF